MNKFLLTCALALSFWTVKVQGKTSMELEKTYGPGDSLVQVQITQNQQFLLQLFKTFEEQGVNRDKSFMTLLGKKVDIKKDSINIAINFPDDAGNMYPYLLDNGVALGQNEKMVKIVSKIRFDLTDRKIMLQFMYGGDVSSNVRRISGFVIEGEQSNTFKTNAYTTNITVNGKTQKVIHIDRSFYENEALIAPNESSLGCANEFVHLKVDMTKFDWKQACLLSPSEQLKIFYHTVLKTLKEEFGDNVPKTVQHQIKQMISTYFEQYLSTALSMQDIKAKEQRKRQLQDLANSMIKNYSPFFTENQTASTYLLQANLALGILFNKHTKKDQYSSEGAFVKWLQSESSKGTSFEAIENLIVNDLAVIDIDSIKNRYLNFSQKLKSYGISFLK